VFSIIDMSVIIAYFRFIVELWSLMHSKISGKSSPRYGFIDSLLIFASSEMPVSITDTNDDVAFSPSSFLIRHFKMEEEYAYERSGAYLIKIFISLTASSFSLGSLVYSSCEIRDMRSCLR
jgi:hypothetical protein